MNITDVLTEYGLSEKAIKVYLTLLTLDSTNLQEVAKRINLPRTTIYIILLIISLRKV